MGLSTIVFVVVLLSIGTLCAGKTLYPWINPAGHTGASPGNFSVYLLRQQWAPEWCCEESWHGWCPNIGSETYRQSLILHGLWPEYGNKRSNLSDGGWCWPQWCGKFIDCKSQTVTVGLPKHCSLPKADRAKYDSEWKRLAPGYPFNKADLGRGWNLADHEFAKHGTCTSLNSSTYLGEQMRLMKLMPTPSVIEGNIGKSVHLYDLQEGYMFPGSKSSRTSVALACKEGRLFGVTTCWGVDTATGKVGPRIECPFSVLHDPYSNNCIKQEYRKIHIKGALPGKCGAHKTKPSGQKTFEVSAGILISVLSVTLFVRLLENVCCDGGGGPKIGSPKKKIYRSKPNRSNW